MESATESARKNIALCINSRVTSCSVGYQRWEIFCISILVYAVRICNTTVWDSRLRFLEHHTSKSNFSKKNLCTL